MVALDRWQASRSPASTAAAAILAAELSQRAELHLIGSARRTTGSLASKSPRFVGRRHPRHPVAPGRRAVLDGREVTANIMAVVG